MDLAIEQVFAILGRLYVQGEVQAAEIRRLRALCASTEVEPVIDEVPKPS